MRIFFLIVLLASFSLPSCSLIRENTEDRLRKDARAKGAEENKEWFAKKGVFLSVAGKENEILQLKSSTFTSEQLSKMLSPLLKQSREVGYKKVELTDSTGKTTVVDLSEVK